MPRVRVCTYTSNLAWVRFPHKALSVGETVDAIIATFSIENKLPILHSDRHFEGLHRHLTKLRNALSSTKGPKGHQD